MAPPGAPAKALPGRADTSPLAGKVSGCLEPKTGSASEALWLLPVPEAISFCSPHSHLCRLVSVGSGNQDGSPRCSGKALPGRVDTSPLAGKVPICLEPEMQSASEDLWLLPVPKAVSFCQHQLFYTIMENYILICPQHFELCLEIYN